MTLQKDVAFGLRCPRTNARRTERPDRHLETALGAESGEWALIQRAFAYRATVCFYDRANRGVSDPTPGPRSARAMIDELAKLVRAAALRAFDRRRWAGPQADGREVSGLDVPVQRPQQRARELDRSL